MERNLSVPDAVVFHQDDQTQIHVQPAIQSGRRHLDVRTWRHGPSGFAPSRAGLAIEEPDLAALQQGIAELLEESSGGQQVARVVWDGADGRRLRAEIEPFGTHFLARLGFWQRARNTWKPVDDGLVLSASLLCPLQEVLTRFSPWLANGNGQEVPVTTRGPGRESLDRWPLPGADWITVEGDRVAFHPRGFRITCVITEEDGQHRLSIRQWKRQESLWLPEAVALGLLPAELDQLLARLACLADRQEKGETAAQEEIACAGGSTVWMRLSEDETGATLCLERGRADPAQPFVPCLTLPARYLARFGRALAQSWSLLLRQLSVEEQSALPETLEAPLVSAVEDAQPLPEPLIEEPVTAEEPAGPDPEPLPPVPTIFPFGADSDTPGAVIAGDGEVRLIVEGYLLPRSVTLPGEVAATILPGLEELEMLRRRQQQVPFVLLSDRPDCAVHARVGTRTRPEAAELRVWLDPAHSESITFEAAYLPEVLAGLRGVLQALGYPVAPAPQPVAVSAEPRTASLPPAEPVDAASHFSPPPAFHFTPLGSIELGYRHVSLSLRGGGEYPRLGLQWDDNLLELPADHLEELLSGVRALYYDALRGRRGHTLSVGRYPPVSISIRNQGPQMCVLFQSEIDGEHTSLSVAGGEIPGFLNAMRAALAVPL